MPQAAMVVADVMPAMTVMASRVVPPCAMMRVVRAGVMPMGMMPAMMRPGLGRGRRRDSNDRKQRQRGQSKQATKRKQTNHSEDLTKTPPRHPVVAVRKETGDVPGKTDCGVARTRRHAALQQRFPRSFRVDFMA